MVEKVVNTNNFVILSVETPVQGKKVEISRKHGPGGALCFAVEEIPEVVKGLNCVAEEILTDRKIKNQQELVKELEIFAKLFPVNSLVYKAKHPQDNKPLPVGTELDSYKVAGHVIVNHLNKVYLLLSIRGNFCLSTAPADCYSMVL